MLALEVTTNRGLPRQCRGQDRVAKMIVVDVVVHGNGRDILSHIFTPSDQVQPEFLIRSFSPGPLYTEMP